MAIGGISNSALDTYAAESKKTAEPAKSQKSEESKKTYTGGRTVGNPKLSEKAAKYYEELKKKYGDMDFVLVSKDKMEDVKKNAAAYGSPNKTVVLIDEEKIERMANDEEYRKKYEGLIENGRSQLKSMAEQLNGNPSIKGFGMQVNDNGTVSFFAAMEKSNTAMNEKLAEKRAAKKAEQKAADKKAKKHEVEEKLRQRHKGEKVDDEEADVKADKGIKKFDPDSVETITADSIEALMSKISELDFSRRADSVISEAEMSVGGSIDYKG